MRLPALVPFLACALLLTGCSMHTPGYAARRDACRKIAHSIRPGTTRRQLYALLPPANMPQSNTPHLPGTDRTEQREFYKLDADFTVDVKYHLANPREYPVTKSMALIPSRQNMRDTVAMRPYVFDPSVKTESPYYLGD